MSLVVTVTEASVCEVLTPLRATSRLPALSTRATPANPPNPASRRWRPVTSLRCRRAVARGPRGGGRPVPRRAGGGAGPHHQDLRRPGGRGGPPVRDGHLGLRSRRPGGLRRRQLHALGRGVL